MVADAVGGVEVEFAQGAGADPRSYRVDFSKIAETLDTFRPTWNASAGRDAARGCLPGRGMDEATFSGDRFVRLSRLKTLLDDGRLDAELRWLAPVAAQA